MAENENMEKAKYVLAVISNMRKKMKERQIKESLAYMSARQEKAVQSWKQTGKHAVGKFFKVYWKDGTTTTEWGHSAERVAHMLEDESDVVIAVKELY